MARWGDESPQSTAPYMYILYLDESGNHGEASYFVLAGLAVFERETYWFSQDLEALQTEYFPETQEPVHFHASRLNVRRGGQVEEPWGQLTQDQRQALKRRVYEVIHQRHGVLFGYAVEYRYVNILGGRDYARAYAIAFEDLAQRFDYFLSRLNRQSNEEQRGLIVLARSEYEKPISLLSRRLRRHGTRWGQLRNLADVPLFAPATDTRMLQYADFCANAIYGRYNSKLTGDFDLIAHKFDREDGRIHGLVHLSTDSSCMCLSCFSRQGRQ